MNYFNQAELDIQTLFTATNEGFRGDSSVAGSHLQAWLDALHGQNSNALRPITEELQVLGEAINRNDAAGMGKAFINLGNLTSQAALGLHSFAGLGDKLRELSQKLASAGGNMMTIAQHQGHSH
ncbi:hypothetical protein HHL22_15185 [Hymenobacter sp. RP-2-7]|uniref:Uncharacterized protein n=1 Tax=Hymenobacter polaris TaxID=2682546 RepID=A0A7Y0AFU1_9BACT|nr:hypothetical protein [Hymenobacter polaris]NML66551.1 hypothetical protein [Hymenobacter polaris]